MITNTPKQLEIMKLVMSAADAGSFITMEKLREDLSYGATCSKQAVLCSLRILEKAGLLAKEYRGAKPMILKPTPLAYTLLKPRPAPTKVPEIFTI